MPEPTYRIAQALHARRAAVGLPKYGQHLSADSPGCMLVHALEEAADLTEYLLAEVQRRREALLEIYAVIANLERWRNSNLQREADALKSVANLLGGEATLAKYDEILGGAENATVAPEPRNEALRVAAEALQFVADHATNAGGVQMDAEPRYRFLTTGQNELIHTVFSALAAIRGAR